MRYIDKLPDPKGEAAVLGTFVHRILENLLSLDASDRSVDQARAIARKLWDETRNDDDFLGLDLSQDETTSFMWKAWRLIERYFSLEDPTAVDVVRAEQELAVEISGVPFFGIVDLTERVSSGL